MVIAELAPVPRPRAEESPWDLALVEVGAHEAPHEVCAAGAEAKVYWHVGAVMFSPYVCCFRPMALQRIEEVGGGLTFHHFDAIHTSLFDFSILRPEVKSRIHRSHSLFVSTDTFLSAHCDTVVF